MSTRQGEALVLTTRVWGEGAVVASLLCAEHGLVRGLIKHATRLGAVLQPLNTVTYRHTRRLETQLGTLTAELAHSRAHVWMSGREAALRVAYVADMLSHILPEEHPYPHLCHTTENLVMGPLGWPAVAEFERAVLETVGYGLQLENPVPCPQGSPLAYVSPNSGRSVPQAVARGWEERLLRLPHRWGGLPASAEDDFHASWQLTGTFLTRALHGKMAEPALASRTRLGAYYAHEHAQSHHARAA